MREQDEAWAKRDTSAKVYDGLYVRHWDEYSSSKKSRLFTVELSKRDDKWVLGGEYFKPLEGTELVRAFDLSYPASLNSIDVPIPTGEIGKIYR